MPYSDWYLDLILDARDAIDALCKGSRSDSAMGLRKELAILNAQIELNSEEVAKAAGTQKPEEPRVDRLAWKRQEWDGLTLDERQHRVLNAVGDHQRTITKIAAVLNAEKPADACEIGYRDLAAVVKRMMNHGELRKVEIAWQRNQPRYAYKRNQDMSREMLDLQAALNQEEVA